PAPLGAKATARVHVPAPARDFPSQLFVMILKSVLPMMVAVSVPVGAWPVFVTVKVTGALVVPWATEPKGALSGMMDSAPRAMPVPFSVAVAVPPGDAVAVSTPDLSPFVEGRNRTVAVQCPP